MNLSDALNSINFTKKNLIRNEDGSINKSALKGYPGFVVLRSLSYHVDCIPWVAYLNTHMTAAHNMSEEMQYEFLLHTIPKGKRFAKWAKPETEKALDFIMEIYKVNHATAKGYLRLMSAEDIDKLMKSKGGRV